MTIREAIDGFFKRIRETSPRPKAYPPADPRAMEALISSKTELRKLADADGNFLRAKGNCPRCGGIETLNVNLKHGFFYCFGCRARGNQHDVERALAPKTAP